MTEQKFQIPKFVTPLSWVVVLMTTIKDLDEFYTFKGAKSIITLIVGLGACICFLILLNSKKTKRKAASEELKKIYRLGLFASLFLLVLPCIASIIYPKLIEPSILEGKLDDYLANDKEPSFFIATLKTQQMMKLVNIDKKIKNHTLDFATSSLTEVDKDIPEDNILFATFSTLLHAKLANERGNYEEATILINSNLKRVTDRAGDYWIRFRTLNLMLKATSLTRQLEGVESTNYLVIFDNAVNEANKLNDSTLIANINLAKTSALYNIAIAVKNDSLWKAWDKQSSKTIQLYHRMQLPEEIDAISTKLNGIRTQYSIEYDINPSSPKLHNFLSIHDSLFSYGEGLIASKPIAKGSNRIWIINSILFDYFTREPPKESYDIAYNRIKNIEPSNDEDYYKFVAQWHQVCGLLQIKRGYDADGKSELLKALKIWHENKQFGRERELTNDLLDNIYTDTAKGKSYRLELLFRWAGLKLLQKNFDPENSNKNLLDNVVNRFKKEGILKPNQQ
jgi:hypothetical protein